MRERPIALEPDEIRHLLAGGHTPRELSRLTVRVESITPDRALGWAWLFRLVRVT